MRAKSTITEHCSERQGCKDTRLRLYAPIFAAIRLLKHSYGKGYYVVANGINLPFKSEAFSHTFVNHFRRYELSEMKERLIEAGFRPIAIHKVLGPLEKITMSFVVYCFSLIQKNKSEKANQPNNTVLMNIFGQFFKWANRFYMLLAWIDAKVMPRSLSAVLLIKAKKKWNFSNDFATNGTAKASAFPAACCAVSERIQKWQTSLRSKIPCSLLQGSSIISLHLTIR